MENRMADWVKSVKIEMIRRDMSLNALAEAIGKSRTHTSAVINADTISPETANAISDVLNIPTAPCQEIRRAIAQWGKEVKIALISRDWKTQDLAKAIGKSRDYTAGVMAGYHINKPVARAISEVLGIPDAPYSDW